MSTPARWEAIKQELRDKSRKAREQNAHTGMPWKDPNRSNGWTFLCQCCGAEVDCGWDDGFGLPHGSDPWDGRTTLEGECQECQAVHSVPIAWYFEFDIDRPELVKAGTAPPPADYEPSAEEREDWLLEIGAELPH